jgi:hypothetical protein
MRFESIAYEIMLRSKTLLPYDYSMIIFKGLIETYYNFHVPKYGHIESINHRLLIDGNTTHDVPFESNEFRISIDNNTDCLIVYVYNCESKPKQCGMIIIYKNSTNAIFHDLAYTSFCSKVNLPNGCSSSLLRFIIHFTKKYLKKIYNIKKIILTDNSYKLCRDCPIDTIYSVNHVLLTGHTWYGKLNFRPYDIHLDKADIQGLDNYNSNLEIMNNITVDDVKLFEIISKCVDLELESKDYDIWYKHITEHKMIY